jgi:hypothetical protein
MDPTSFMSEHTAEYVLVNDLVHRLSPAFPNLLPMFFWATREGNRTAIASMHHLSFRLLTCFARRPKVDGLLDDNILMKINRELKQYHQACTPLGIPVLAGLPMIRSLSSLRLTSVCNWFSLADFDCVDQAEFYVAVGRDGTATLYESDEKLAVPLTTLEIENLIRQSSQFSWNEAVSHLRDVRRVVSRNTQQHYMFFGVYKPFFVAALED